MKMPRLPILIVVPVLLAGGALGVIARGALFGGSAQSAAAEASTASHERVGVVYPMKEQIVNLADPGVLRYLKTTVVLEVFDPDHKPGGGDGDHGKGKPELPKYLRSKSAVLEDRVITLLSSKMSSELRTTEGKAQLKEEIRTNLNAVAGDDRILAVSFVDFVIQ